LVYFTFFDYIYHTAADIFYLVIGWLIVGIIIRSPWKQHLKWAVPVAIDTSCQCCMRFAYDLHYFGHVGTRMQTYVIGQSFLYTGSIIGIYGTWMFYVVIKQSLRSAAGKDLFTQPLGEAEPGVWPPAPRVQP